MLDFVNRRPDVSQLKRPREATRKMSSGSKASPWQWDSAVDSTINRPVRRSGYDSKCGIGSAASSII